MHWEKRIIFSVDGGRSSVVRTSEFTSEDPGSGTVILSLQVNSSADLSVLDPFGLNIGLFKEIDTL